MTPTQAAASAALSALLARRRGIKTREGRLKRRGKPAGAKDGEKEKERSKVVERNVRALKKAGRVREGEKEVRKRVSFLVLRGGLGG